MENKELAEKLLDKYQIVERLKRFEEVYIYGAGMVGQFLYDYLLKKTKKNIVNGFLTTEGSADLVKGLVINSILVKNISSNAVVLLAAKSGIRREMLEVCRQRNVENVIEIDVLDDRTYDYYSKIPEKAYPLELIEWFKLETGGDLNLDNPKSFNDKINWIKVYEKDPRKTELTDKYKVRKYVQDKIGSDYLINNLGVWEKFDDIDFNKLPEQFVLKCNHGCEWNIIVDDRKVFNMDEAKHFMNKWMATNYTFIGGLETQYLNIEPRIIAEEYLENDNRDLYDYKFWCFGGKVEFIMFLSNRKKTLHMDNYSKDWKLLPFTYNFSNSGKAIPKPDNLDEMIEVAETMAEGFNFVRVDLYRLNNGQIKFGEMTFTPASGMCDWSDKKINYYLGDLIKL